VTREERLRVGSVLLQSQVPTGIKWPCLRKPPNHGLPDPRTARSLYRKLLGLWLFMDRARHKCVITAANVESPNNEELVQRVV
jgi:hypothetical protein